MELPNWGLAYAKSYFLLWVITPTENVIILLKNFIDLLHVALKKNGFCQTTMHSQGSRYRREGG